MLDRHFKFEIESESFSKSNPYNLTLKQDTDWKTSRRRLLVIFQTVDGRDLKAEELLGDRNVYTAFKNAYSYSKKIARSYLKDKDLPEYALTVANFNAYKHLHIKSPAKRREAEATFADRVNKLIKKINPTHILFSGDESFHMCYPNIPYSQYKRGWVHEIKDGDVTRKVTSTVDFARLLENNGEYANLLGFFCRDLAYLQLGKNPHDLSHVKTDARYVKTIEQFDTLMRRFDEAEECAIDTETKNLSSLHNAIYTIQFAFDKNPDIGYVLSVDHPLSHWTKEETRYVKQQLRKRFAARKGPLILTFNGHMFDLRVIRQTLKIPIMWLKVWEISFGEHELDENMSLLNAVSSMTDSSKGSLKKSTYGGLAAIYCSYGNDFYYKAVFSKGERDTAGSIDPSNKDFCMYAATDVVCLLAMKREQLHRASVMEIEGKSFKPYFVRHMLYQMSDTAHSLSHMRNDGSAISRKEIRRLMGPESPLRAESARTEGQLRIYKEVKQANKELLAESGFKAGNLFGGKKANWIFQMSKPAHKKKLFFDVLKLEPLAKTETGEGQIDKDFINFYKDKNKIVGLYGDHQAVAKLMSTYVKGWYKRLQTNLDEATDAGLRADYFLVDTGRLGSSKPNLQQIPSRGKLAKIIKGQFWARPGYVQIQFDYSAHEVRMWGVTAGDKVICDTFRMGQELRQAFIQDPSDANRKAVKEKGDVHLLNVKRFFNQSVDKNHPLRHAIKAVVFGVLYGKGPETLGEDTKQNDLAELKEKIATLYDESLVTKSNKRLLEINEILEELDIKLTALIEEDKSEYAQDIIDRMFNEFKAGRRWIEKMGKLAEQQYYVYSPNGRVRHLYAAMTGDKRIISKQVRRGSNAPIQGFASEIGAKAARMILEDYNKNLKIFKEQLGIEKSNWDLRVFAERAVHDALYFMVPYEMVIPFIQILQHQATYGVARQCEKDFNIDFIVEPEIEIGLSARGDKGYDWDWSIPNLITNIKSTLKDAEELGVLAGTYDEVLEMIVKPWKNKATRNFLQENYPLLGIKNLDKQIREAVREV